MKALLEAGLSRVFPVRLRFAIQVQSESASHDPMVADLADDGIVGVVQEKPYRDAVERFFAGAFELDEPEVKMPVKEEERRPVFGGGMEMI